VCSISEIFTRVRALVFIYYKIVHWVQYKHIKEKVEANTEKIQKII